MLLEQILPNSVVYGHAFHTFPRCLLFLLLDTFSEVLEGATRAHQRVEGTIVDDFSILDHGQT